MVTPRIEIHLDRDRPKYVYELVIGTVPLTDRERRIYNAGLRDGYSSRDLGKHLENDPALLKVGL